MARIQSRKTKRSAFTLVELLIVILIIAIMVSMLAAAVAKVMDKIPEVKTRTEISELEVGLQGFMNDYNLSDPPPSLLILNEVSPTTASPLDNGRSAYFLQKVFGKNLGPTDWNGDGQIDGPATGWILQGQQCLIFYLGGIPNTAAMAGGAPPQPQGFSTNNMNPSTVGGKRRGPYYTFETPRLVPNLTAASSSFGFMTYQDPWQVKIGANGVGPMPYVYFSSYGVNNGYSPTDCNGITYTDATGNHIALPYWTAQAGTPPVPTQYVYSNKYQIISAGKDGKFGYNAAYLPATNNYWSPSGGGAQGTQADDQANFSSTLLGKGQN